jgi:hypothetical protein
LIGIPRSFYSSGGTVVVVQHPAQALAALNLACVAEMASFWTDELVRQTLVIAFTDNARRSSEWLSSTTPRRRSIQYGPKTGSA